MKQLKAVRVESAPGYNDFQGWEYDRFEAVDKRGELVIVIDDFNEILIVPAYSVTQVTN